MAFDLKEIIAARLGENYELHHRHINRTLVAAQRVIGRLRGDDSPDPPALLLLSATPYRLFTRRWEEEAGTSHRSEFFELVEFLYGADMEAKRKRSQAEAAFSRLET